MALFSLTGLLSRDYVLSTAMGNVTAPGAAVVFELVGQDPQGRDRVPQAGGFECTLCISCYCRRERCVPGVLAVRLWQWRPHDPVPRIPGQDEFNWQRCHGLVQDLQARLRESMVPGRVLEWKRQQQRPFTDEPGRGGRDWRRDHGRTDGTGRPPRSAASAGSDSSAETEMVPVFVAQRSVMVTKTCSTEVKGMHKNA